MADGSEALFLTVSYDGEPFAGYQRQDGQRTVQGQLEKALRTILGREVATTGAGRTDGGVHALGQVVSFAAGRDEFEPDELVRSLNALAGPGIVVRSSRWARAGADARFSALSREYRYRVVEGRVPPLFLAPVAWWVKRALDHDRMVEGAGHLIGPHDFAAFCVASTAREKNTVRTVLAIEVMTEEHLGEGCLTIRVVGEAFVHSMVRIMVGTLVEVGVGRRDPAELPDVLESRRRECAGETAPPHGLTLWRVEYPDDIWTG